MKELTYDQIVFKASHNSEERREGISDQLSVDPGKNSNNGCMGIELDIHRIDTDYSPAQKISRENFMVGHDHDRAYETLASYLEQLLGWHYQNPNHDVILVSLDQKNDDESYNRYHEEIDAYLQ